MKSSITGKTESEVIHSTLSQKHSSQLATLRDDLTEHILMMKTKDETYARSALKEYNQMLPWMELNQAIREALK